MQQTKLHQLFTGLILVAMFLMSTGLNAQEKAPVDHSYKPLMLKLNEDGSKYIRFILWHQMWLESHNLSDENAKPDLNFSVRRSRMLAYAQVSPRFLILTHFGLNSLNASNLTKLGNDGDSPQLFLHDAWTEFMVSKELYIGAGLHYWKGLTRLASQSTLNFMSLDQSRPFVHWHSLGYTDQFARHLGLYAKGNISKFNYRLSWNEAGRNSFDAALNDSTRVMYNGVNHKNRDGDVVGNHLVEGYFHYSFWDNESTKLPYFVGSYLGSKKVFNIGAGFFAHPNGAFDGRSQEHLNVTHFAVDAFLDMPVGEEGSVTAYASYISFNYGDNWVGRWSGTGSNLYLHAGYYVKSLKLMPYVAINSGKYEGNDNFDRKTTNAMDVGVNYHINGHNAKLSLEYHGIKPASNEVNGNYPGDVSQIRMQAHIFL